MTRRLCISFERPEDFRAEFERNIAKGGVFIPGVADLALREVVEVEIALEFIGERRTLEAEIVHVSEGAGVAVQFLRAAGELRAEFGAALWAEVAAVSDPVERRRSPRARVRFPALLDGENARVEGVTRTCRRPAR
jgi:hypothetical protein